jgi:hypothetical protein
VQASRGRRLGPLRLPARASAFDLRGDVLAPLAPRPLDLFAVRIENGIVKVDVSAPIGGRADRRGVTRLTAPDALARWRTAAPPPPPSSSPPVRCTLPREPLRARPATVAAEAAFVGRGVRAAERARPGPGRTTTSDDRGDRGDGAGRFSGIAFEGDGMKARFFRAAGSSDRNGGSGRKAGGVRGGLHLG